jgi:hypothetical protein
MIIGIEFNKVKIGTSNKTFIRVAPYLENVDRMKVGVISFLIFATLFLFTWSSYVNAGLQTNNYNSYQVR